MKHMGKRPTVILLHAPSVYDFREHVTLRGPVSDLVPSSSIFEMYPIGFTSIAAYLEKRGYGVRVLNIAAHMLHNPKYDVEQAIAGLSSPKIFGIDLHWLPHAHGSLAIMEIVKKHHPDVPTMFGGFSSTYFHEELITYPQVDFVVRGDSTERAVYDLVDRVVNGGNFAEVANLTWKDADGKAHVNPLTYSPDILDEVDLDFRRVMISAVRDRDLTGYLPSNDWLQYPIMLAMTCRGCTMNCVGCGGSASAFSLLHGRKRPVFQAPEKLAQDMYDIVSVSNSPIFVLGDIRQGGKQYVETFLSAVKGIQSPILLELFTPASREFMEKVAEAMPNFAFEISLESHDPVVRAAFGKHYATEEAEKTFQYILDAGAYRLDVFFMVGLPHQTYESVMGTADYIETLLEKFGGDGRIFPFIGPMAPFVDPGSLAFEHPDQHGYHILFRTLEEHRQALLAPSWQFTLNYETNWMTRAEIVLSTYDASLKVCDIKEKFGLVTTEQAALVRDTLQQGRWLAVEIERLHQAGDTAGIMALRSQIEQVNALQGVAEDGEIQLPIKHRHRFKWFQLAKYVLDLWSHPQ